MLPLLAVVVGGLIGFVGSRSLRRSARPKPAPAATQPLNTSAPRRRRGLTAPELQRACFSEMVRHVRVDPQGRSLAPSSYMLQLHPDDLQIVDEARGWFADGLAEALVQASAENGWTLAGAVDVRFEGDGARRPGAPKALAIDPTANRRARPTDPPPAAAPAPRRRPGLAAVRADTGESIVLGDAPVTIGRATDQTFVVDDKRISRRHATIAASGRGWTVTDQGSANGTRLNGTAIPANAPTPISAGDTIGVGPLDLHIEASTSAPPEPGTRALDDSDRTRISGQVLPKARPER